MATQNVTKPIEILLVEDSPGDILSAEQALKESIVLANLSVVRNGAEVLPFLCREEKYANVPRPNLILLSLDLPKKYGRKLITEIKSDEELERIPIVGLIRSKEEAEIREAQDLGANCYVTRPINFDRLIQIVRSSVEDFWLTIVELPSE